MKQRPWIPVAVVLAVLLAATVVVGFGLRDRLSAAALVLDPTVEPGLAEVLATSDDIGVPACTDQAMIAAEIRAFHVAVDAAALEATANGETPDELSSARTTFDSFLLKSAIARSAAGKFQLLVRARSGSRGWCVDEAVFSADS